MNIIFFILAFIGLAHSSDLENLKVETWERHDPKVIICSSINVDFKIVASAMKSWQNRGHKFSGLTKSNCEKRPKKGEIAIYPASSGEISEDASATTIVAVYNDKLSSGQEEIAYARILVDTQYSDSKILFEHELGHALGYHHDVSKNINSIMHENIEIY